MLRPCKPSWPYRCGILCSASMFWRLHWWLLRSDLIELDGMKSRTVGDRELWELAPFRTSEPVSTNMLRMLWWDENHHEPIPATVPYPMIRTQTHHFAGKALSGAWDRTVRLWDLQDAAAALNQLSYITMLWDCTPLLGCRKVVQKQAASPLHFCLAAWMWFAETNLRSAWQSFKMDMQRRSQCAIWNQHDYIGKSC